MCSGNAWVTSLKRQRVCFAADTVSHEFTADVVSGAQLGLHIQASRREIFVAGTLFSSRDFGESKPTTRTTPTR